MKTHTPGPWHIAQDTYGVWRVWADYDDVCGVAHGSGKDFGGFDRHRSASGDDEADARLIAAAPDLLAACKNALSHMDRAHSDADPEADKRSKELRAAIAKAEGGAS